MAVCRVSSYMVWIFLLTLAVVHCAARGRRKSKKSRIPYPAATDPRLTCAAYGKCCQGSKSDCGPYVGTIYCNCDEGCHGWDDCCPDRDEFCNKCDAPFVNVQGKCIHYVGKLAYYSARKTCEGYGATIVMPWTQQGFTNFANSDYFNDISGSDESFDYWINCIMVNNVWYWRTVEKPWPPVTWNDFIFPPQHSKTEGLICLGIGNGPWDYSKQTEPRNTFCQK